MVNYVIDRSGNRKPVSPGYVLQHGERAEIGFMTMDGKPADGAGRISINDVELQDADRAYYAMNDQISNAWQGDAADRAELPSEIVASLPSKHMSVFLGGIAAVNHSIKGPKATHLNAIGDLRRQANELRPWPGMHGISEAQSKAVADAIGWIEGFCAAREQLAR